MAPAIAVVGAVASVVGTVQSVRASKRASAARQQQERNQRRRSARQNIRQAQLQRAAAVATSVGSGSFGGSGSQGGIGAIGSNLGGALGFSSQQSALSGIVTRQENRAATWSGIASIGNTALQLGASYGGFDNMFGQGGGGQPDLTRAV